MSSSAKDSDLVKRREAAREATKGKGGCQGCRRELQAAFSREHRTSRQRQHQLPSNQRFSWRRDLEAVPVGGTSGSGLRPSMAPPQARLRVGSFLAVGAVLTAGVPVCSSSVSAEPRRVWSCSLAWPLSALFSQAQVPLRFPRAASPGFSSHSTSVYPAAPVMTPWGAGSRLCYVWAGKTLPSWCLPGSSHPAPPRGLLRPSAVFSAFPYLQGIKNLGAPGATRAALQA